MRQGAVSALIRARQVTARFRPLPDFLVIGAQKCGTSTLHAQLCAHRDVVAPLRKEVHYFDFNATKPTAWYRANFPAVRRRGSADARHLPITGESSPYYLFHPAVPERVHALLPDVALLAIVRDPVARAVSEYHHAVRHGLENRSIDVALDCDTAPDTEAIAQLPVAAFDDPDGALRRHSYVARGYYADQLERWFARFGRAQLLVLETGQLRDGTGLARAEQLLGIAADGRAPVADRNTHAYPPPPTAITARLEEHYAPHNMRLFELLGRDFGWTGPHRSSSTT